MRLWESFSVTDCGPLSPPSLALLIHRGETSHVFASTYTPFLFSKDSWIDLYRYEAFSLVIPVICTPSCIAAFSLQTLQSIDCKHAIWIGDMLGSACGNIMSTIRQPEYKWLVNLILKKRIKIFLFTSSGNGRRREGETLCRQAALTDIERENVRDFSRPRGNRRCRKK